jgi:hypothetical protein
LKDLSLLLIFLSSRKAQEPLRRHIAVQGGYCSHSLLQPLVQNTQLGLDCEFKLLRVMKQGFDLAANRFHKAGSCNSSR